MRRPLAWLWPLFLPALVVSALTLSGCSPSPSAPAEHPVAEHPEMAGKRTVYREEVAPPVPASPFHLIDHTGEPLALEDLKGKVVVLTFVYTRCPDVCPLAIGHYLTMQEELGELVDDSVALVLVTTDPDWDTPERLHRFTRIEGGRWHFLSGERARLEEMWRDYDVYVTVNPQGVIQHEYKVYLIDRQGMIRYRYGGLFSPEDAVSDIRSLLAE